MLRKRERANYHQLGEFDGGRIIGLSEGGFSVRKIASLALTGTNPPSCSHQLSRYQS